MSKLSAFFEKKKKKSLKTAVPSGMLEEKPKPEVEETGTALLQPEEEASEWAVDAPQPVPQPAEDSSPAPWLKVSVVDAASVKKKSPERIRYDNVLGEDDDPSSPGASLVAGEGEGGGVPGTGEGEDGLTPPGVHTPEDGSGKAVASPATPEKAVAPAAPQKWVPRSLRGKKAGPELNFDNDQDVSTVAQLGLYNVGGGGGGGGGSKKKNQAKENKKEKNSAAGGGGADSPKDEKLCSTALEDELPPVPSFTVWKFISVEGGVFEGCKAVQDNDAVREKYMKRRPRGRHQQTRTA